MPEYGAILKQNKDALRKVMNPCIDTPGSEIYAICFFARSGNVLVEDTAEIPRKNRDKDPHLYGKLGAVCKPYFDFFQWQRPMPNDELDLPSRSLGLPMNIRVRLNKGDDNPKRHMLAISPIDDTANTFLGILIYEMPEGETTIGEEEFRAAFNSCVRRARNLLGLNIVTGHDENQPPGEENQDQRPRRR